MNSKQQGDIGVAQAIYYYTKEGYVVSIPNTDNSRYDLIVDRGGNLMKVQCKTTFNKTKHDVYTAQLRTSGGNQSWGGSIRRISKDEVDLVWISTGDEAGYEFPAELLDGRNSVNLGPKYDEYKVI